MGGRLRRHVPDFLVAGDRDALTVVDVKPLRRLDDAAVRFTFGWTGRLADWLGWRFEVFSEPEPRVLANVRFLAGYRRGWQFDAAVLEEAVVLADRPWPLADLEWLLPEPRGHGWRPGRTCCICCGRGGCARTLAVRCRGRPGWSVRFLAAARCCARGGWCALIAVNTGTSFPADAGQSMDRTVIPRCFLR